MMSIHNFVKRFTFITIAFLAAIFMSGSLAFADPASTTTSSSASLVPLNVSPDCSDATTATAYWNVDNTNAADVNLTWTNVDNGQTGSFVATPGSSYLATYFASTDPNNTTQFVSESNTTQTNGTEATCAVAPTAPYTVPTPPTTPTCIDGAIQQNLNVAFTAPNVVSITTAQGQPLCTDVSLEFSSYTMPADYNGQGFFTTYNQTDPTQDVVNPTAYPQAVFANQAVTLAAGTTGTTTMTVTLPDSCNNTQVDVYYAPEQSLLGPTGNGTANILSEIYPSTGACATTTGGSTTTTTPVAPVTTVTSSTTTTSVSVTAVSTPLLIGGRGAGSSNDNNASADTTPTTTTITGKSKTNCPTYTGTNNTATKLSNDGSAFKDYILAFVLGVLTSAILALIGRRRSTITQ